MRQTLRPRVHLATPTSGFKPTPFGKFLSLKNGWLKAHNLNMYMRFRCKCLIQTLLKFAHEDLNELHMGIKIAVFYVNFVELYHKLFHMYVDVVGTVLHQKVMMLRPQVQRKPREITNLKKPSEERWMNCGMVSCF